MTVVLLSAIFLLDLAILIFLLVKKITGRMTVLLTPSSPDLKKTAGI